jgi:hypothetical protein
MTALASRVSLDFVIDCGADPTGVADCAPAIATARTILTALATGGSPAGVLVQQTLELFIPPGIYAIRSDAGAWDFNGVGTSFTLRGVEDASVFVFYGEHNGFILSNAENLHVRDLGFCGTNVDTPDTGRVLDLNCLRLGTLERCHFFNIMASSFLVQLQGEGWAMRDTLISECACSNAAFACVYSNGCPALFVQNCQFLDVGHMNGFLGSDKTSLGNTCWLRHDGSAGTGSGGQVRLIQIEGCEFDEGAFTLVTIHSATNPIPYVELVGNLYNPSALGSTGACLDVQNVERLEVRGMISSGFTALLPTLVKLASVTYATFDQVNVNPAGSPPCNIITADSACSYLEVKNDTGGVVVQSQATSTVFHSTLTCFQTFQTDVTGTPAGAATIPVPNGILNGNGWITGRLVTPGVGPGSVGDGDWHQWAVIVKVQGGAVTFVNFIPAVNASDAAFAGTTYAWGASGSNLTATVDTTAAGGGAGMVANWQVVFEGKQN